MAWYDNVWGKIGDYARSKIRQLESFFARGLGPQQANHLVKESSALQDENKKGVMPHESLLLWREFNASRSTTLESLPTMRSQWLRQSMSQTTHFRSGFSYRYLLDFTYQVRDSVTGEIREVGNTLGFRRLTRWGKVLDTIEDRISKLHAASEEYENIYSVAGSEFVQDSVVIKGFYRTVVQ